MKESFSLTRKVVLEHLVRQPDNAGGFSESWQVLGAVWVEMRAGAGRERARTGGPVSSVPYRIFTRAAPLGSPRRPVAGQRFVEGNRRYRIEAVSEVGNDGLYLECFTREEVRA